MESPCINCITLAICKAMMKHQFAFAALGFKCSIFIEHYNYRYMDPGSQERILLLNLFKPLHWEERLEYDYQWVKR